MSKFFLKIATCVIMPFFLLISLTMAQTIENKRKVARNNIENDDTIIHFSHTNRITEMAVGIDDAIMFDSVRYRKQMKGDTTIYMSDLMSCGNDLPGCGLQKIYFFKKGVCVLIFCNYIALNRFGQTYLMKREEITSF